MSDETQEIQKITDEAIEQGYQHADNEWKNMAMECVRQVCLSKQTFTVNDVRWLIEASPLKTQDNRAMGGIMRTAMNVGWIAPTGQSIVSKVGHKSLLQIWKSRIYKHERN